jgi:transcriptional regulator with XRE-family HTH domain
MSIGIKIRQIRESKGIKQQTIADVIGVSQPSYQKMETGETKIKADDLIKIAASLDTPLEEFVKEELAINNIQYNKDNAKGDITNFNHNAFENERKMWEKLITSKDSEIEALREIIKMMDKK